MRSTMGTLAVVIVIAALVGVGIIIQNLRVPIDLAPTAPNEKPSSANTVPGERWIVPTSTFAPNTFRGPSGPPHIIGPKSNPPNY